jgi:hypothetical protein
MDRVRDRLKRLRDEARALADAPSVSLDAVNDWRRRASAALEEIYGADSEAARDFSKIKFDDAQISDGTERILRDKATEQGVDISGLKIPYRPIHT